MMRQKSVVSWCVGLLFVTSAAFAAESPVTIVKFNGFAESTLAGTVLHKSDDTYLVRNPNAKDEEFENLYVVHTQNRLEMPNILPTYGKVLAYEPGHFTVMRVEPQHVEELSAQLHKMSSACGSLLKIDGDAIDTRVAPTPIAVLPVDKHDPRVKDLTSKVEENNIKDFVGVLSAMPTRHHQSKTGQGVADFLARKYEELSGGRSDVSISTYEHNSRTNQKSLVVRITGQTRPDEVIVLGSHIDSINLNGGVAARSPGADDNASGTSTNLEIFRVLMSQNIQLDRTLEIHGYAAEEVGLVGSADMARRYKAADVNVVAMVQHDMNLWKASGTPDKIWFVTNYTEAGFTNQLTKLVDSYVGMAWGKKPLYMGSSDHASWYRQGYATAFPFENPSSPNDHIHTSHDTLANARAFSQAAGFAKLGVAYVAHFGGLK